MATHKTYLAARIDDDGRLTFDDVAALAKVRAQLRGQAVRVLIEKQTKPRSLQENGYYWGVVIPLLCDWSGYSKDEMHDALKEKFLISYDDKTELAKFKSSADLSTLEFENYMSDIREWASRQGVFIPLPNEEIY